MITFRPVRLEIAARACGSRPIPRLVGSRIVWPPRSANCCASRADKPMSYCCKLSRLTNGSILNSPRVGRETGASRRDTRDAVFGGWLQVEKLIMRCSCIRVTPIALLAIGPRTVCRLVDIALSLESASQSAAIQNNGDDQDHP